MFKKILIVGAAGLLTAAVLTQTKVGNLAWGWMDRAERHLEAKIKPEDEVRRIKKEVSGLDKEIERARGSFAEESVEAKYSAKKVDDLRVSVDNSRKAVEARKALFSDDSKFVKWDNRTIPVEDAKVRASREVAAFISLEKEYKSQEKMLAVRERTRTLAEQHVQALISQKAELEAAVTELEADIKVLKIEQVESRYQNDGTKMAKVKNDLESLRKRIEIQREKLAISRKFDPKSVENKSVDEIFAEMDAKDTAIGKK